MLVILYRLSNLLFAGIILLSAGQNRNNRTDYVPIELAQKFGVQQVGETRAESSRNQKKKIDIGIDLYYRGDIDGAIEHYNRILRIDRIWPEVHFNLGMAYAHKGDFDRAIEEYR